MAGRSDTPYKQRHRAIFSKLRITLDQPDRRWLLGILYTVVATLGDRRWCWIHWDDGCWTYRYAGQILLSDQLVWPSKTFDADLEIFLWDYKPMRGHTILDIGAGTGTETIPLARLVGETGRVIAVEAHPRSAALLRRACALNSLDNVTIRAVAISETEGTTGISDGNEPGANTILEGGKVTVPMMTLDSLISDLNIDKVDFLKMNIEGAERLAIRGGSATAVITDRLAVSCHDFLGSSWGRTRTEVRRWLEHSEFTIRTRPDDPRPWCRDYLYASRNMQ